MRGVKVKLRIPTLAPRGTLGCEDLPSGEACLTTARDETLTLDVTSCGRQFSLMGHGCGTRLFLKIFLLHFFFYVTFESPYTRLPSTHCASNTESLGTHWSMVHELTYSSPRPRSWLKHKVDEGLDSEEILSLGEAEDP